MVNRFTSRTLLVSDLGLIDYKKAWDLQKELFEERQNSVKDDILLLLEHPHTYTLGKTADRSNLIGNDEFLRKKKYFGLRHRQRRGYYLSRSRTNCRLSDFKSRFLGERYR